VDAVVGVLGGRYDVASSPDTGNLCKFPRYLATGANGRPVWLHEILYHGTPLPLEELSALCHLRHLSLLATLDTGVTRRGVFVVTERFSGSDILECPRTCRGRSEAERQ